MRIGHGFDAHRFIDNKPLRLCGINIPYHLGMEAHSDGDVAIHALCDAMLGAVAAGDIGQLFPDDAAENCGRDSRQFLSVVNDLLQRQKFALSNLDMTIVCQAPKLKSHISDMRQSLAEILAIDTSFVSIKATTTEKMGYTGREEGISAHCVVLLKSI